MTDDPTPTTLRRQLGARLRALRVGAGKSAQDVAGALGCSPSKISRIESGARAVSDSDMAALIAYFGVSGGIAEELRVTATGGRRRRRPWVGVAPTEGDLQAFVESGFIELERDADRVRELNSGVVPGLLQTADYMRAMMIAAVHDDEELIERAVAHRMSRQRRLGRRGQYTVVLDEAVLLRRIGTAKIMARQLQYLEEQSRNGIVDLRVIPLETGYHPGLNSSFVALTMGESGARDVVFVEGVVGFQEFGSKADLDRFEQVWGQLIGVSTNPEESRDLIAAHRKAFEAR